MIPVHALLTENAIAEDFVSSLRARRLAEKFFYWFPLSVRAWLALCSDGAYRNFVRSRSLIVQSTMDLGRRLQSESLEVLSLGSGQGGKDLILLESLVSQGKRVRYIPVDASQALLEMACGGALEAGIWAQGIKADFTSPEHVAALVPGPDTPPRLVLLLGNTLGAFDPIAEARVLAGLLRSEDHLIVDGEIYAGGQTVAGYVQPLNGVLHGRRCTRRGSRTATGRSCSRMGMTTGSPACTRCASTFGRAATSRPVWAVRRSRSGRANGSR
jgi:uncharacterized SAM-dependent methyltransferase